MASIQFPAITFHSDLNLISIFYRRPSLSISCIINIHRRTLNIKQKHFCLASPISRYKFFTSTTNPTKWKCSNYNQKPKKKRLLQYASNSDEAQERLFFLRGGWEGVNDGCVEWVTQVGGPVVERALAGGGGLDCKAQEAHHGKTGVLDLRQLKGGFLLWIWGQAQWVEVTATWVQPLFWVQLCVPLELYVANYENLDPDQCGDWEWKWLP